MATARPWEKNNKKGHQMNNVVMLKPPFDILNFHTYTASDVEEGISVVLDSQFAPQNAELEALRHDRKLTAEFFEWVAKEDLSLIGAEG